MIRKLFLFIFCCLMAESYAQLNNAWIDYGKTYYKFKLAANNLCRIPQPTLAASGLSSVNADHFQLWRNGSEVRLFTSVTNSPLGSSDFIEFAAELNDGKVDAELYRNPDFQLADKYSLETDTSSYFLTVNSSSPNLRYQAVVNNAPAAMSPEPYFMRKAEKYFKNEINRGDARSLGEQVYSSSYDQGEGWSTFWIESCCSLDQTFSNLHAYNNAPPNSISLQANIAGASATNRTISIKLNGTELTTAPYGTTVNFSNYLYRKLSYSNLPISILAGNTAASISLKSTSTSSFDKFVAASIVLTYPSEFNFSGESVFGFQLDASVSEKYLVIDNFQFNSLQPVLLDKTNGLRLLGEIASSPGQVKFLLPPSAQPRNLILLSQQNPLFVTSMVTRNFIDFNASNNQSDYIIISHPALYDDGQGNNFVDEYRQYRSSAVGGGFNARIYDIAELTDQFGYGINNHPSSIRDFIHFAHAQFSPNPKFVFIIGRGVNYIDLLQYGNSPSMSQMHLVPSFGWPASDILLSATHATCLPTIPIGRLAAISGTEVRHYLDKIREYELAQQSTSPSVNQKAWMKNFIHVVGGKDSSENTTFRNYMRFYEQIARDTFYGANVETFTKTSTSAVQQASGQRIEQLFNEGLSFIGYFGHSSANTFEFNLSNPEIYQNQGKYPFFNVSGCSAGNFYIYDPLRPSGNMTLSEKYVLAQNRGSIAFLADNHFGVPPFLNFYNNALYKNFSYKLYGDHVGNQIKAVASDLGGANPSLDFYTRIHLEEINLHGDPALRINSFEKPDYVVEEPMIKITPNIISVADNNFKVSVQMRNMGKAVRDSIRVTIKQRLPGDSIRILYDSMIRAVMNQDSVVLTVPIRPNTDKGQNQIIAELDVTNRLDELFESNNIASRSFVIFEDELRPVYPGQYSIVNTRNNAFYASTANPLTGQRNYIMELDTSRLFNSPFKRTYNKIGPGGLVEFRPDGVSYTDSTVYYWRVAVVPLQNNPYIWNTSSFVYLPSNSGGYNMSHYYQQADATGNDIQLDADRVYRYVQQPRNLIIRTGLYPYFNYDRINVNLDFVQLELYGCIDFYNPIGYNNLQVYVFDTATLLPWRNSNVSATNGLYGSAYVCPNSATPNDPTRAFFEFNYALPQQRRAAMDFLDLIPNGMYVAVTNLGRLANTYFIDQWKSDTLLYGSGQSLYHKLRNIGFTEIDSFYKNLPFLYFYKKGDPQFVPTKVMGPYDSSFIERTFTLNTRKNSGSITTPAFGPARQWQSLNWGYVNNDIDPTKDTASVRLWGVRRNGSSDLLANVRPALDTALDFINAATYPFIKLEVQQKDDKYLTPLQIKYLQLTAEPEREGAVAPAVLYSMKDSLEQGEPLQFAIAFKNIGSSAFDSLKIKMVITDQFNRPVNIDIPKARTMTVGDTILLRYTINTRSISGNNTLYVDFNPDNDQQEQFHFNNILYKNFYVHPDRYSPLLDVTFDGVHILNRDLVSAKPHIQIRLKDESKYLALNDTSFIRVQLRHPDQTLHDIPFGDLMQFQPAQLGSGNNTATVDFKPVLMEDGDYELIVSARDSMGNESGQTDYRVIFTVVNKAMISNLLNYPNPFTTSTAFVFTLTGSQIPQNIRIQILTVTGKVVREITSQELGPIHIGRNITEYKWDGTDSYGQPLANGVYLYRVLTNLNGQALEKYRSGDDNTDQYFTKGYGKMYLMR